MSEPISAPSSAPAHKRLKLPKALTMLAAASAIVGGVIGTGTLAMGAVSPSPSPSPSPTATADDVTGTLSAYGPFVVTGGASLSATLTLSNIADAVVPEASVTLAVTSRSLDSSDAIADFYDDPSGAAMRDVASVAAGKADVDEHDEPTGTGTLPAGTSTAVRVAASAGDLAFPADTSGVYGVTASYAIKGRSVAVESMAVTWLDGDVASLPVTAIATIDGAPSRVSALLSAANLPGVSLLVDPTAITSTVPTDGLAGRDTFILPATNPDIASLAHAEDVTLIAFALEDALSHGWSDLSERPWLALSPVADVATAAWATKFGAAALLFDADHASAAPKVSEVDGWVPAVTTVEVEDAASVPLIVPNDRLSDLVASFRPTDPAGPSRIVAESALLAFEGDGTQGVVVTPGTDWIVDGPEPNKNLQALLDAPWVTTRDVTAALADPRRGTDAIPKTQGTSDDVNPDRITALGARLKGLGRIAQTVQNPDAVLRSGGRGLLGAAALSLRANTDRQEAAYASATKQVESTLNSVTLVQSSNVNLIANSGDVPITIHNDLPVASTVTVVMRSNSPNLQVRDLPTITVPAGSEATALVPVEAVSTADVSVSVWLENADGEPIAAAQEFTMRVRADWGNAATAIFTALLVLVMIAGIIRTVRRGRKDTRTGPGPAAEAATIVDGIGNG